MDLEDHTCKVNGHWCWELRLDSYPNFRSKYQLQRKMLNQTFNKVEVTIIDDLIIYSE